MTNHHLLSVIVQTCNRDTVVIFLKLVVIVYAFQKVLDIFSQMIV